MLSLQRPSPPFRKRTPPTPLARLSKLAVAFLVEFQAASPTLSNRQRVSGDGRTAISLARKLQEPSWADCDTARECYSQRMPAICPFTGKAHHLVGTSEVMAPGQ